MIQRKSLRYPILGAIGLLAGALPLLADYPTEVLNDGPLAYYRLNDNVSAAPIDWATNSGTLGIPGNGAYSGVVQKQVAGPVAGGFAAGFSAGSAMRVPFNASLNPNPPFSFEFWVRPDSTATLSCPISSTDFAVTPRLGWLLYIDGSTGTTLGLGAGAVQLRVYSSGGTANNCSTAAGTVTGGAWHHIVGVADATSVNLYVNGNLAKTLAWSGAYTPVTDKPVSIGVRYDNGFALNGSAAHAAVYNFALSPALVKAHFDAATTNAAGYAAQLQADGPAGYWKLDEPTKVYPTAVNSGSLAATADAKYYGGVVNSAGPRSPAFPGFEANNSSGQFDGASGYVGSPLSLLNNRAKYTVMGWLKRGVVHSTRGGYFGQNDLLEFGDADSGVNVEAWVDAIGTNLKQAWPWADDQWGFICLTGDGQTNILYMDGLAVQGKPSNVLNYGNNTWKFNIGGGGIFNTGGDFFNGNVDEVAMFDKALSPGRILTLYCIASGAAYAPNIYSEPPVASPSNTVYATTTFSLVPDIGGSQPMTFQWQKDGVNIPGATTSTYTKANCTAADAGSYTVVASNAHGTVANLVPVVMTINPATAISIVTQPVSRSVYAGGQFTFTVEVTGTLPTFQWKRNGSDLPGETGATISVVAGAGTIGTYTCNVANGLGSVLSDPATASLRTPAAGSYEAAVVADAPRAFWRLNEAGGTLIQDSFGRHDGTATGFLGYGQPGVVLGDTDTCLTFDGATAKVDVPYSAALNSASFTLECWANISFLPTTHASPVTCRDSSGNLQNGYMFYCTPNGAAWEGWVGRAGYAGGWNALAGPSVAGGTWTHLAMSYDTATSNQQFFVNGTLVASGTTTLGPNTTRPFRIGAGSTESAGDYWFPGNVDDVVYYPAALSADRIALHYGLAVYGPGQSPTITQQPLPTTVYPGATASFSVVAGGTPPFTYQWKSNNVAIPGQTGTTLVLTNVTAAYQANYSVTVANAYGNTTSGNALLTVRIPPAGSYEAYLFGYGPLAYWRLDETSGTVAYDRVGGHNGNYNNVTLGTPGALTGDADTAATFAGSGNSAVTIGNPVALNFSGQITLTAWIKPTATDGLRNIIMHGYQTSPNNAECGLRIANGSYQMVAWNGTDYGVVYGIPAGDLGTWVHLVSTYDGTAWHLYRNGVEVGSSVTGVGALQVSSVGWAIGARGNGTERFHQGDIDEVAIFNKALTADQVNTLYLAGKYAPNTPPAISQHPVSSTVIAGATAQLSVNAAGSPPLNYQWEKGTTPIPGATLRTFTLPGAYYTDSGNYRVVVGNGAGSATSSYATLTVLPPPSYANQTNDLVLHLKFENDVQDSSGRANHGIAVGTSFVSGRLGQALRYSTDTSLGAYNYVILNPSTDLQFTSGVNFSVAFWIKFTGAPGDLPFLCNNDFSYGGKGLTLAPSYNQGAWSWYINDALAADWGGIGLYAPTQNTLNDGNWHHLLYTFDRTGVASVYRDGALDNQTSIASAADWNLDTGMAFLIGQAGGAYGETAVFDMDDMGIWRRALNNYEAASVYAAAQNGISFDTLGPVKVYVNQVGSNVDVSWQGGILMQSTTVNGTYTPVPGATAPFYRTTATGNAMFFKVGN